MFKLVVIGTTSESRTAVVDHLQSLLQLEVEDQACLPPIDLQSCDSSELKFQSAPDLAIFTEEFYSQRSAEIFRITKQYTQTIFYCHVGQFPAALSLLEQLARLGIQDTIGAYTTKAEFSRKLILLSARSGQRRSSKLILVEGAKGGVGVTSLVASLASVAKKSGSRTVVIDLDFSSQDLSRFLYSQPFINENLGLIFNSSRPVTEVTVRECLANVWGKTNSFLCMSPYADLDLRPSDARQYCSIYFKLLKLLDAQFDLIIVDAGSSSGEVLKLFRRVADRVLFVLRPEVSAIYSAVQTLRDLNFYLGVSDQPLCVFISPNSSAINRHSSLLQEVSDVAGVAATSWSTAVLPYESEFSDWPLSGRSIYDYSNKRVRLVYEQLYNSLNSNLVDLKASEFQGVAIAEQEDFRSTSVQKKFNQVLPNLKKILKSFANSAHNVAINPRRVLKI